MAGSYTKSQHSMQGAFVFVLLGLFALMSTLMVLLGAQMYRATVDHSQQNNQKRLLSAYVRSMVRAQDSQGTLDIEDFNGTLILCMRESFDEETYVTRLYAYEGRLYEDFTNEANPFDLGDGTEICDAGSFDASMDGELLTVKMTDAAGDPAEVRVALRCVGE